MSNKANTTENTATIDRQGMMETVGNQLMNALPADAGAPGFAGLMAGLEIITPVLLAVWPDFKRREFLDIVADGLAMNMMMQGAFTDMEGPSEDPSGASSETLH